MSSTKSLIYSSPAVSAAREGEGNRGKTGLRVLIVDEESSIRRFLHTLLPAYGYIVLEAATGREALAAIITQRLDIIVLDLELPDFNPIQLTRLIRVRTQIPIVILCAEGDEKDKVAALNAGADDCLTKPFASRELLARLRAALPGVAHVGVGLVFIMQDLRVDLERRTVAVGGHEVHLTPTEYELLRVLVTNAGKVLTHHQLLREVRGMGCEDEMHLLPVHISKLRRKLERDPMRPRFIRTEPGVGYRLGTSLNRSMLEDE